MNKKEVIDRHIKLAESSVFAGMTMFGGSPQFLKMVISISRDKTGKSEWSHALKEEVDAVKGMGVPEEIHNFISSMARMLDTYEVLMYKIYNMDPDQAEKEIHAL